MFSFLAEHLHFQVLVVVTLEILGNRHIGVCFQIIYRSA